MRICYIANSGNSHTEKWARYFIDKGHEVHVISHVNREIEGAVLHYINYNLKNFILKVKEVHDLIDKINPDVLHAQQANTCGLYAASKSGYRVIVSAWGSDILVGPEKSLILKKMVQYVLKRAYFITSDSEYMSKKIIELGGNESKVYTFPMGVEDSLLNYKRDYNNSDKVLRIISNRRLEDIYNIDIVIRGFAKALKINENLHLTIAASGSKADYLKSLSKELNISDRVEFTGRYKPEDIGPMLSKSDIFISVPKSDSTSVSLLEAMCCGLFPIVCDLPANKEWVTDRDNGYVIKDVNEDSVKDSILWCCENKKHIIDVSDKNMNIIRNKALWKNNAQAVEDLYNRIINE